MAILFSLLGAVIASVSSLTPAENAMAKITEPSHPYMGKRTSAIQEILDQGKVVILTDSSKWLVMPADRDYVAGWLSPADIVVELSGTPQGPYTFAMTNLWTKKTVLVRKLE